MADIFFLTVMLKGDCEDDDDFDDDDDRFAAKVKIATTEAVGKFSELLKEGKLFDKEGNFL